MMGYTGGIWVGRHAGLLMIQTRESCVTPSDRGDEQQQAKEAFETAIYQVKDKS